MAKPTLRFRTIVISDVHLGTPECKIEEVNDFLKHTQSDKLILNGDIVDVWSLKRKGGWSKAHTRFIRTILKKAEKKDTLVIYVRGNHDDFFGEFIPLELDNLKLVSEYVHETPKGNYLVVHGDAFDVVATHSRFFAILGDIGYQTLLRLNHYYNKYRAWRGYEYFSISKAIKAKVKKAVCYISRFEDHLQSLAAKRNCKGVICGHIHNAMDKMIGKVHYLNSGDWVESLTALVEDNEGNFSILDYPSFREKLASLYPPSTEETFDSEE